MEIIINSSWYLFIKDFLTFCLTLAGIIIAGWGLKTWKKQIKGTKEFDIAYNLNYSVLKLREAIKSVRNPAVWNPETEAAKKYIRDKHPERSDDYIKNNPLVLVYEMRWEGIRVAITEMESHLLGAELLWGKEIVELVRQLSKKVTQLNVALQHYFTPDLRVQPHSELSEIIYDTSSIDQEDKFSKEVNEVVKTISEFIKKKAPLD